MIVIIDTTEFFNDLRMDGPAFKLLLAYLHRTGAKLVIPGVVFEETVNHFKERLQREVIAFENHVRSIDALIGSPLLATPPQTLDQPNEVAKFRSHLLAQISLCGGRILNIEEIDVSALLHRALQRRKPFDREGKKGFRDAMLWESVLREVIQKGVGDLEVALVTKNSNDFCQNEDLADDLKKDCIAAGKPEGCVKVFAGMQRFIEEEAKPRLERLEDIRNQLNEGNFPGFDPIAFYSNEFDSLQETARTLLLRGDFESLTSRQINGRFHSPFLECLNKEVDTVKVIEVLGVDGGQLALQICYSVGGMIACQEEKVGYWPSGDEVFEERYDEDFCGDVGCELYVTVIVDRGTGEVKTWEADCLDINLGWGWPYLEQD